MHILAFTILGSFFISALPLPQASDAAKINTQQPESITPRANAQASETKNTPINIYSPRSEEKKAHYDIMSLAGGYFELLVQNGEKDVVEQISLIESTRPKTPHKKAGKQPSSSLSKTSEAKKVFGDSPVEAAMSIVRAHSKYFITTMPGFNFIGWGGKFQNKIHRIEIHYSIDKMPITDEFYSVLLFTCLEDINRHEERFRPYLATFPISSDEYELRLMLPEYRSLSPSQSPTPAFIFNIGDTIFFCHREKVSGCLKVYKQELFSEIIEKVEKQAKISSN